MCDFEQATNRLCNGAEESEHCCVWGTTYEASTRAYSMHCGLAHALPCHIDEFLWSGQYRKLHPRD